MVRIRAYLVIQIRRCPPLVFILFSGDFWVECKKSRLSVSNGVRFIRKDETRKHEDRNADIPRTSSAEVPPTCLYFVLWWIPSSMQKISSLYLERCPIHPKSRTLEEEDWMKCEHTSYLKCGGAPLPSFFHLHLILRWILSKAQKISCLYLERCSIYPKRRYLTRTRDAECGPRLLWRRCICGKNRGLRKTPRVLKMLKFDCF